MKLYIKIVYKTILIVLILVFLSVWLLNIIIKRHYIQNGIKHFINAKIKEFYPVELDFTSSRVSIFPLEYTIYGVRLFETHKSDNTLLSASKIAIRVSWVSLIASNPKLSFVLIHELKFHDLFFTKMFDNKIDANFKNKSFAHKDIKIPWPLFSSDPILERLILTNINIPFKIPLSLGLQEDAAEFFLANLFQADIDVRFINKDQFTMSSKVNNISIGVANKFFITSGIFDMEAQVDSKSIQVSKFHIKDSYHDINFSAKGLLDIYDKHLKSINWKIALNSLHDITVLKSILDIKGITKGVVELNSSIDVPINLSDFLDFSKLKPRIHFKLKDVYIDNFYLRDQQGVLVFYKDYIAFENAKISLNNKIIANYNGKIFLNPVVSLDFALNVKDLNLSELLKTFGVEFDTVLFNIEHTQNLRVIGQANPLRLNINTQGSIKDLTFDFVSNNNVSDFKCNASLDMNIDAYKLSFIEGSTINCNHQNNTSMITNITLGGKVGFDNRSGINLVFKSSNFDLSLVRSYLGVDLLGTSHLFVNVVGPYNNIKIIQNIQSKSAVKVAGMTFSNINANFVIYDKYLRWSNLKFITSYKGEFISPKGQIRFKDLYLDSELKILNYKKDFINGLSRLLFKDSIVSFDIDYLNVLVKGYLLYPLSYLGKAKLKLSNLYFQNVKIANAFETDLISDDTAIELYNTKFFIGSQSYILSYKQKRSKRFVLKKDNKSAQSIIEQLGGFVDDTFNLKISTFPNQSDRSYYDTKTYETIHKSNLIHLPVVGKYFEIVNFDGDMAMALNLDGNFENISGSLDIMINNINIFKSSMSPVEIRAVIVDRKVDMIFSQGGNSINGRFNVDLGSNNLSYKFYASFFNSDIQIFMPQYFSSYPQNYMYFTGEISLQGDLTNVWASEGYLQIKDLIGYIANNFLGIRDSLDIRLVQKPITIYLTKNGLNISDDETLTISSKMFDLAVNLKNNVLPHQLNLILKGKVDVRLLHLFVKDLETAVGEFYIKGSITGDMSNPKVNIKFYTESILYNQDNNIILGLSFIKPYLSNIQFDIVYKDDVININYFRAKQGKGRIRLGGIIDLKKPDSIKTNLKADLYDVLVITNVPFADNLKSNVNGVIYIDGVNFPVNISGNLEISNAQSVSQFDFRKELVEAIRHLLSRNIGVAVFFRDPYVNFDIGIKSKTSVLISNKNFNGNIGADLKIIGNDINPILTGYLKIENGVFKYKRNFNITRGLIIFDDTSSIDPRLDIVGVSEISGYKVYVIISNKASNINIDFSIDPPMKPDGQVISKLEILRLISDGTLYTNISNTQQDYSTQQLAGTEAFSLLMSQLEDPLEKILSMPKQNIVKEVYLDAYSNPNTGSLIPRINVPLSITDDWNMMLRIDDIGWNLGVTYLINQDISLQGNYEQHRTLSTGTSTVQNNPVDASVDLKFKFSLP